MIARVRTYDYADVCKHLERMRHLVHIGSSHDIVAEMKHMVPEFKSNNSQWQKVDVEVANDDTDMMTEKNLETVNAQ